ncbi:MAG: hypothetical protein WAQ22_04345 [Candidatus Saccharimonas sp.]
MIKKRLMGYFVAVTMFVSILIPGMPAYAACDSSSFLGMPAWYRGLQVESNCSSLKSPSDAGGLQAYILTIALNLLQAALVIVAYVTIAFVIKGGFTYITSAGSPEGMKNAKNTIRDALIGMAIAIASAAIVNTIAGVI